jgi:hypothetical protein
MARHGRGRVIVRGVIMAQQRDGDFGAPHLDPVDAGGDQLGVIARRIRADVSADRVDDSSLDFIRGDASDRACRLRRPWIRAEET